MKRQQRRRLERDMGRIASRMQAWAKTWTFNGQENEANMRALSLSRVVHHGSGAVILFTRDTGHHTSGWLKNPDYERCWHLSLSPIPGHIIAPNYTAEMDATITKMWCEAFFGEHLRWVWAESPKSKAGMRAGVWHWRLFADENWEPIKPRGEVYSTQFTELGWKSASEVFELTGQLEPVSTVDPS
jgi:hypothetical protein